MRAPGAVDVEPTGAGLAAEDDVLPHGQVVGEHEVLEHHADAGVDGVGWRAGMMFAAVDVDRALIGAVGAIEGLHQRRLAGAVLADDGVDLPGCAREVDAVVGDHAREALDDVAQLDRREVESCATAVTHVFPLSIGRRAVSNSDTTPGETAGGTVEHQRARIKVWSAPRSRRR